MQLKNKFIQAPLKLGYSDGSGRVQQRHLDFYARRGRYFGAVIPEPLYLDPGLRELPTQLGIDSDEKTAGLSRLTGLLHSFGTKVIAHLNHPGRMANPKIPGNYFVSASAKACENGGAVPEILGLEGMQKVIGLFTSAAKRAEKAGFDYIELQFGHGYLAAQFLSPTVNDRSDDYGGGLENRMKFPLEIFNAVKKAVNIGIIVRISGSEMVKGGFELDDMIRFSKKLKELGALAIHVSAGSVCNTPPWFFQHMFVPKGKTWEMAQKIRQEAEIPAVFVGRINHREDVDVLLQEYKADFIAIGRAIVADPDFVGKVNGQIKGHIRPCLACAEGCLGGVKQGKGLGCVVNPLVNSGLKEVSKAKHLRSYAVVGAGLAGMQAALNLKKRGHKVDLYEKNKAGGQFRLAALPPGKSSLKWLTDYFLNELNNSKVDIVHKEFKSSDALNKKYDAIIAATGAVPAVPPIKGLKEFYWTEFLEEGQLPQNQKVLVIGGGLIGLEVASKLIDAGNKVVIVEMMDEIARGMEMIEKAMTTKKVKGAGTEIFTGYRVVEIDDDKASLQSDTQKLIVDSIDKVVLATGMRSYQPFGDDIEGVPVYYTGDAEKPSKAQDAIRNAWQLTQDM